MFKKMPWCSIVTALRRYYYRLSCSDEIGPILTSMTRMSLDVPRSEPPGPPKKESNFQGTLNICHKPRAHSVSGMIWTNTCYACFCVLRCIHCYFLYSVCLSVCRCLSVCFYVSVLIHVSLIQNKSICVSVRVCVCVYVARFSTTTNVM